MNVKYLLVMLFSLTTAVMNLTAQATPRIELVPSQTNVQRGDLVNVDVVIHNGTNVAGLDLGLTVDEECLRIVERQDGDFLPMADGDGAFSAYSALNPADTRLAVALTDRTKYVNGDGTFYRIVLEAICDRKSAPVTVNYAQVSSYVDPATEIIEVISYELSKSTLSVENTVILIGGSTLAEFTPVATDMTAIASATPEAAAPTDEPSANQGTASFVIMITCGVGLILLVGLFFAIRKKSPQDEKSI